MVYPTKNTQLFYEDEFCYKNVRTPTHETRTHDVFQTDRHRNVITSTQKVTMATTTTTTQ